jgi:hypothetical protein
MKHASFLASKMKKTKTRQFTDIFFENEISLSVKKAKKEIREILCSLKDGSSVFTYSSQIVTSLPCDFPRLLVEWGRNTQVDTAIKNVVISAFLSAEEKVSGSSLLAAGIWCCDHEEIVFELQKPKCTFKNLEHCLNYFGGNGMAKAASIATIELGALGHRVEYEETDSPVTKLQIHEGKEVFGSVDPLFGDKAGHTHDLQNCLIVAIDGVVETVSSIHNLMEVSSETTVVIMAKSFLPDVSNSMAETWTRNLGKCLPYVVSSWGVDDFLNLEKFGISCISSERGDVISSMKLSKTKQLSFSVLQNRSILRVPGQSDRSKIVVSVSKTLGGLTGVAVDRIKSLVGIARLASRSGVVKWEMFSQDFSNLYSRNLVVPRASLKNSVKTVESMDHILQELGCVIIVQPGVR